MTDSDLEGKQSMAETTISRHVGELEALATEQYMASQGNQQYDGTNMKLIMEIS